MKIRKSVKNSLEPLLCLYQCGDAVRIEFALSLILIAKENTPNRSDVLAMGRCQSTGYCLSIAKAFARATRVLSSIKRDHGYEAFCEVVNERKSTSTPRLT